MILLLESDRHLPYLQLDLLSIDFDDACAELNANRMWAIGHELAK